MQITFSGECNGWPLVEAAGTRIAESGEGREGAIGEGAGVSASGAERQTAAACQALRHDSQTIATFAWVAGYLVPLFIGEQKGAGGGGGGAYAVFLYLTLLSAGVFVVAQRRAWPVFTGLALMGAHGGAAYIFRVSHGALQWTLLYLLIVTGGMFWVSMARRAEEGRNFGVIGAIAGYLITGVAILAGGHGPLYAPYMYLLLLSGTLLVLGHVQDWPTIRWCAVIGSFVGLLLLYRAGTPESGPWLLVYAALSVAGSLAASTSRRESTEPPATTSVLGAYAAATLFAWSPTAKSISPEALFGYLAALALGVLVVAWRMHWVSLPRVGSVAAFLATGLLYQHAPQGQLAVYPMAYLVFLSIAVVATAVKIDDRWLGGIGLAGAFAALPLTGVLKWQEYPMLVPAYLGLAALASVAVVEWRKWFGLEWLPLVGTWLLYVVWRFVGQRLGPAPEDLAFTTAYLLIFLGASWVRHGVRQERAEADNSIFMGLNAATFFGVGWYDLSRQPAEWHAPGMLALTLFALYLVAGLTALRRSPGDACFGPVLTSYAIFFLTTAPPLLFEKHWITVAWAAEATVLMAIGFACRSSALRVGALVVVILPLVKAISFDNLVGREGYQVLLNSRALGTSAVIAALYIMSYLYWRWRERAEPGEGWLGATLGTVATVLLWWVLSAETWCYTGWQLGLSRATQHFALSGVWIVFAAVLIQIGIFRPAGAFRWCGVGLLALTAIKVFAIDPRLTQATYTLIVNSHTLPLLCITALLFELTYYHLRRGDDEALVLGICGGMLFFWICCSETWMYLGWVAQAGRAMQHLGLSIVWLIFAITSLSLGMARRQGVLRGLGLLLFAATIFKVFVLEPAPSPGTYIPIANNQAFPLLVIAAMLFGLTGWYRRVREELNEPEASFSYAMPILASGILWWVLTAEAWRFTGWVLGADRIAQQYALSAVWTAYGAALVTVGLLWHSATYRWTALTLFGLTVAKVLIFDLASLSGIYRVLASMGLGLVLIVVSFGYQRLVKAQGE